MSSIAKLQLRNTHPLYPKETHQHQEGFKPQGNPLMKLIQNPNQSLTKQDLKECLREWAAYQNRKK